MDAAHPRPIDLPTARASVQWGERAWTGLKCVFGMLVLIFTVFPAFWIVETSFKPESEFFGPLSLLFEPTLANYQRVLAQPAFALYFRNTLTIAVSVTVLALAADSLAAYALARYQFRGAKLVAIAILSARLVPGATMIIPYFALFRWLGLTDSLLGLILAYTGFSLPFAAWMLYGFFQEVPADIEDSGRIDGCSDFDVFWRIVLPLTLPGLGATGILVFISAWNEFLFALVLAGRGAKTLPVFLASFISEQTVFWGALFAVAVVMILPTVILMLVVQRSLVRGLTAGAVKG